MSYRIRIGHPNPGTYSLPASDGFYLVSGQTATLTYSGGGGGGTPLSGAFHYDPTNGSDANNGILVGESGSGTTLNGTAGTGARQTFGQFATDMDAGRYSPGDTVYIHPPGYVITSAFPIRSNSTTTQLDKLIITSLPGERDNTILDTDTEGEQALVAAGPGHGPIYLFQSNISLRSFVIRHQQAPIHAGNGGGIGSASAFGCEYIDLVGDQQGTAYAGDNSGFIMLNGNCNDFLVRAVRTSNSGVNNNNGLIYYINCIRGTIEYCDLTMAGSGSCIHHKRSSGIVTAGDVVIRNNFLKSTSGKGTCHLAGTARHLFQNNIHSGNQISWGASGVHDAPLYQCQFIHDTFYGGTMTFNPAHTDANLQTNEGEGILLRSNLFGGDWFFWSRTDGTNNWPAGARDTSLDSNYNHFAGGASLRYFQYQSGDPDITLATWQANATGDTGQDANSVSETPQYEGTPSNSDPTTFRLASGSAGNNAGHDSTDMGADVDDIGPGAIGF